MNNDSLVKTALNKAMAMCASREYCRDDIRTKLNSWSLNDIDSETVLSTLIKENFINETRYAEAFVKDKYYQNKWGKLKIAVHLRAKKINSQALESALNLIDDESYHKMIKETLSAHARTVKAKNQYDLKGKLLRFGLSRGFESNILYDILNDPD